MPWIPAAVQTGLEIYKAIKGKSPEERQQERNALEMQRMGLDYSRRAGQTINPALAYWQRILGGSRQAATEAMAPELQGAAQRQEAGRKSLLSLSSRSGGAAARLDPYAKGTSATNILLQARRQAPQGLLQGGQALGGLAGNLLGTGAQSGQNMLDYQMNRNQADAESQRALGRAWADIFDKMRD